MGFNRGTQRCPTKQRARRPKTHYYAALDLVAEGHHEQAVAAVSGIAGRRSHFHRSHARPGARPAGPESPRRSHRRGNRIAELDPDDVLAHTSLSVLYQKKGMIPEAEAEGNKARVLGWKQQLKKIR